MLASKLYGNSTAILARRSNSVAKIIEWRDSVRHLAGFRHARQVLGPNRMVNPTPLAPAD
jgi:hypothetical protein